MSNIQIILQKTLEICIADRQEAQDSIDLLKNTEILNDPDVRDRLHKLVKKYE